jgi:deoxyribodipyrimidine photo-lyase
MGSSEIVSHEETGNAWTYARDRAVAAWARDAGVPWTELPHSGCGAPAGLAAMAGPRAASVWCGSLSFSRPDALPPHGVAPGAIPSASDLGLAPDHARNGSKAGANRRSRCSASFLTRRGQTYRRAMSSPLDGEAACSRLSPHLAWGTISGA